MSFFYQTLEIFEWLLKPQTLTLDLRTRNGDGSSRVQIKFRIFLTKFATSGVFLWWRFLDDVITAFTCAVADFCVQKFQIVCIVLSIRQWWLPLAKASPRRLTMNVISKKKGEKAETIRLEAPTNQAGTILAIVVNVTEWNQLILHSSGYIVIPRQTVCIHHQKLLYQ